MMEESNDEQPEMVSHEEAVLAEREATQLASPGTNSKAPTPVSAPSPLPAFLTQKPVPLTPQSPGQLSTLPDSKVPSQPSTPKGQNAPGILEIPHEGERLVEAPINDPAPTQPSMSNNLFGWFTGNSLVNKMVEKTKSSMETVITTLDPGMKNILYSVGDIKFAVTSTNDTKVIPVRDAFQNVFGRVSVTGKSCESTTAAQPVGFTAGLKGAEERISSLCRSGNLSEGEVAISVEGFIVEILPEKWYEMSCLVLKDFAHDLELQTFSQPTFIPADLVMTAQDKTPLDYPLRWAGLAVTIGEVIEKKHPHIGHADWQMCLSGVSRRQSISLAAQTLAHMYKEKLPTSFVS